MYVNVLKIGDAKKAKINIPQHAGSLGQWDDRLIDQASEPPILFFS